MTLETLANFIGISLPLITIAGSAVAYVVKIYNDAAQSRRKQFFDLMGLMDAKGTIASKLAAIYELRSFPEHKDFIVMFCRTQKTNIDGASASLLEGEMQRTIDYFTNK